MNTFRQTPYLAGDLRIAAADIVTSFQPACVGTRVTVQRDFMAALAQAIGRTDFAAQRVPGQALVNVPEAILSVSAGVGVRRDDPDAYVCRNWRGHVGAYLKREYAARTEAVNVVVYTLGAYLADPDCSADETALMVEMNPTHVIVAILATAGPRPAYSPRTLVRNLAGANNEALVWTADEIRQKAKESLAYDDVWATVAD